MDIHQLRTFVTVAREGSITRASELLHLSQPAVSAHIKAIEDALQLVLFDRTPRGMILTRDGQRLLTKAQQTLAAHHELEQEALRIKGKLTGKLRIGAGSNTNHEAIGRLIANLAERCPDVEVAVEHGTSREILAGIRSGTLDAGFYNEAGEPEPELATIEVSDFTIFVAAAPDLIPALDWKALGEVPWIYPPASACCGRVAEKIFAEYQIRPKRVITVDRVEVTRTLIAAGIGVGLLHADAAKIARERDRVELLYESPLRVRALFASLASRAQDPLLEAASAILRGE